MGYSEWGFLDTAWGRADEWASAPHRRPARSESRRDAIWKSRRPAIRKSPIGPHLRTGETWVGGGGDGGRAVPNPAWYRGAFYFIGRSSPIAIRKPHAYRRISTYRCAPWFPLVMTPGRAWDLRCASAISPRTERAITNTPLYPRGQSVSPGRGGGLC